MRSARLPLFMDNRLVSFIAPVKGATLTGSPSTPRVAPPVTGRYRGTNLEGFTVASIFRVPGPVPTALPELDVTGSAQASPPQQAPTIAPPVKQANPAAGLTPPSPAARAAHAASPAPPADLLTPSEARDAAVLALSTARSLELLACFFPVITGKAVDAYVMALAGCVDAAHALSTYLPAAVGALVADPTKPLPFVPPTVEIAEFLWPRVTAWAVAGAPRAGVAPILAGCERCVRTLAGERLLRSLIAAARAAGAAPSDEIFVRCNLLMGAGLDALRWDWLTADDAGWLLQRPFWTPELAQRLAGKAGAARPTDNRLHAVSGSAENYLGWLVLWGADKYDGTSLRAGPFSSYGRATGYGRMTWFNHNTYLGTFANGSADGWGVLIDRALRSEEDIREGITPRDPSRYEGEIKNGNAHGRGVKTMTEGARKGDRFEGIFEGGKLCGHGVKVFANGERIEGEFKDDRAHGDAVLTYPNGDRLEAPFKNGTVHGHGVKTFANGDRLETQFENSQAQGRRVITLANGGHFESPFGNNQGQGQGVLTLASGDRIEGEFKNCDMHGHAVVTFACGDGASKGGKQSGTRTLTLTDGSTYLQTLVDGQIVQETRTKPPVLAIPFRIQAGAIVDATDHHGDWYLARILTVSPDGSLTIGFCGFRPEANASIPAAEVEARVVARDTRHGSRAPRAISPTEPLPTIGPSPSTAGTLDAAVTPWLHDPPAPWKDLGTEEPTPWTPRSKAHLQRFFPLFAAPTVDAFLPVLSDCVPAAECLKEYCRAAAQALVTDPTTPLPFVPPTDAIAEYLLPRVKAWAAAVEPRAGVAPILAGCEQHVQNLMDARRLQSLIEAPRAADVAPSDEIFVRCNLLMNAGARESLWDWLQAADAAWLLRSRGWAEHALRFLATRAGQEAPADSRLVSVSGPAQAYLAWFGPWGAQHYAGTIEEAGGLFRNGQATGYGVLTWTSGKTYKGTFAQGCGHGWGMLFEAGFSHEGEFKNNAANGRGVRTFANGDRVEGTFEDGTLHGHGIKTFANGDSFAGEFKDDKAAGRGRLTLASGDCIEGAFKDDGMIGPRTLTLNDGSTYVQTLLAGRMVHETRTRAPATRLPFRIRAGAIVDAADRHGDWYLARIIAVWHDGSVQIGLCGFSPEADDTIPAAEVEERVAERDTRRTLAYAVADR